MERYIPKTRHVQTVIDKAIARFPNEEIRIRRGAEIVEKDGVRPLQNGSYHVGIFHYYPVNDTCPCPDSVVGFAIDGRCKHVYARWIHLRVEHLIAQEAMQMQSPRFLEFYASLGQLHGVATIWEDGTIIFIEHDSEETIYCSISEVVLGGRKDIVDAAWSA